MSLDPFSCIVKYKMKLMFWPYKMIDCHLTAFFQVHETPPVQETGREFATRSGDIQAVVRFITITINSSPSPPSITIIIKKGSRENRFDNTMSSCYLGSNQPLGKGFAGAKVDVVCKQERYKRDRTRPTFPQSRVGAVKTRLAWSGGICSVALRRAGEEIASSNGKKGAK